MSCVRAIGTCSSLSWWSGLGARFSQRNTSRKLMLIYAVRFHHVNKRFNQSGFFMGGFDWKPCCQSLYFTFNVLNSRLMFLSMWYICAARVPVRSQTTINCGLPNYWSIRVMKFKFNGIKTFSQWNNEGKRNIVLVSIINTFKVLDITYFGIFC